MRSMYLSHSVNLGRLTICHSSFMLKQYWLYIAVILLFVWGNGMAVVQKKIKVACVGNSVTYGALLPDREQNAYPSQLQQMLGDTYDVRNFGKSGTTLLNKGHRPYKQQPEYRDAFDFAADKVIIHLGLNDTDPRDWPNYRDYFIKDYLDLIASFKSSNPDCKVWICRMSPIFDRHPRFKSGTRDWYGDIQKAIEEIASYAGIGLIDFQEILSHRPELFPDALHPNVEGAKILAKTVYSRLTGDYGGLQMPVVYTDKMVLQRDKPLNISGMSNAGEKVVVSINGIEKTAYSGFDGKWKVLLPAMRAGGPYILTISTKGRTLMFHDVLIGEVWLCSGQSNMAFRLRQSITEKGDIAKADNPNIRFFDMKPRWETHNEEWSVSVMDELNALHYYKNTHWADCTGQSAADFSAVAYYFGKVLADSLGVPIGLIHNAVGGSPCEAWIDRNTLEYNYPDILENWKKNDCIQDWVRERATKNIKQASNPLQRHPYEPCYLFESGIIPLAQYPVNGVIWYQGESNAHNIEVFERLFPLLVDSWRKEWSDGSLPFYYVQLSSIDRPSWPWFRDSQRKMMDKILNIYMAVSSDRGDSLDVHPRHKKEIGERLAAWALNKTFNKGNIVPSGPLFKKAELDGDSVCLTFDYAEGIHPSNGSELSSFELAEIDGLYYPAQAVVKGDKIKVWSNKMLNPRFVRYGWQPFTRANMVNGAGFPASTFKADCRDSEQWDRGPRYETFPDFPVKDGVSAPFAGICGQVLLVAGGCNFPNIPAAEGGKKAYYKEVWGLDLSNNQWMKVGYLPHKVAYGTCVSVSEGVICIGGMNEKKSLTAVTLLGWDVQKQRLIIKKLPQLPFAVDNGAAAVLGRVIYLTGGNQGHNHSNSMLYLDMDKLEDGWQPCPDYPGAMRLQPVMVSSEGKLYLMGGFESFEKNKPILSTSVLSYNPVLGRWSEIGELPVDADGSPRCMVGGCGVSIGGKIFLMGGVNYTIFSRALSGDAPADYLSKPVEWYRFNSDLLSFDIKNGQWHIVSSYPALARAGAAVVTNGNRVFYICGELKPGIRSSVVSKLLFE